MWFPAFGILELQIPFMIMGYKAVILHLTPLTDRPKFPTTLALQRVF